MSTLLERIGGEAAVKAVVESVYDKVFTDLFLETFSLTQILRNSANAKVNF